MTRMNNQNSRTQRQSKSTAGAIFGALAMIVAFIIARCGGGGGETPTYPMRTPSTMPPTSIVATATPMLTPGNPVAHFVYPRALGASSGFWEVFFTSPDGSSDTTTYTGGLDEILASEIDAVTNTLDIVAYEFNSPALTAAVQRALARGVRVRIVTDNEDGIGDSNTTLHQLQGAQIVADTRSALMHNKFMILDGITVWTGSWNYTINDTYRNNNNAIALRSQRLVANYQTEFDEMFLRGEFGPRSTSNTPNVQFVQDGVRIATYFAPEDDVLGAVTALVGSAQNSIRFMTFSYTLEPLGDAMLNRAAAGVDIQGIFERTGSETIYSRMTPLFCAGVPVRQDGNRYILHHKVIVIDRSIVIIGSFNFSNNAATSNDENLLIVQDANLAAQYLAEFDRRWAEALVPNVAC